MDRDHYEKWMGWLLRHFPYYVGESGFEVDLAYEALRDLSEEQFATACAGVRNHEDLNRGSNLIAAIRRHVPRPSAAEAYEEVMAEVRRVGSYGLPRLPVASRRAISALGGWGYLCEHGLEPAVRAQFRDAYNSISTSIEREGYRQLTTGEIKKLPGGVGKLVEDVAKKRALK